MSGAPTMASLLSKYTERLNLLDIVNMSFTRKMGQRIFSFAVVPFSALLAAVATGLYFVYWADWVAEGAGYGLALALPVPGALIWGGCVSFLCTRRLHLAPAFLCGIAAAAVVGWVLFALSRIH